MIISRIVLIGCVLIGLSVVAIADGLSSVDQNNNTQILSLVTAVQRAQANDPWLQGNQHVENSMMALSIASGTLPDPIVSVGFANVPTDTLNLDQERMTQFKVGVAQMFARGDSLAIKKRQLQLMSSQYPHQREDRKAKVAVTVAALWLDAYKAQESIALIEKDRSLFEQLADVAEASYSSALGKTRQQDIVRAQLELTRLNDRLTVLKQHRDVALQQLGEWLSLYFLSQQSTDNTASPLGLSGTPVSQGLRLTKQLPEIALLNPELYQNALETAPQTLHQHMIGHAAVRVVEQKIKAFNVGIELAQQKYKPEWGVNVSYGARQNDPVGQDRADLLSVGVSFDVPLFTGNKQDKELQSAVSLTESIRTDKWLLLRKLMASFEANKARLLRLDQRRELYRTQLLPQMSDQAEASLSAYTNDDGDFSEVVRARIAELNANIDALSIDVDRQKVRVQLNYFFMSNANQIITDSTNTYPVELRHAQ